MKTHNIFKGKKDEINLSVKPSIEGESFKDYKNTSAEKKNVSLLPSN